MAYTIPQNFKQGLDTRRSELTSVPGCLVTCENGHVNQGGEIEKRKAFVKTILPEDTFGLEAVSTGLVVFGSVARVHPSTDRSRAANVATVVLLDSPNVPVGIRVTITGMTDGSYNATNVLTLPGTGAGQIFYASVGADEGTTPDATGTITELFPTGYTYQQLPIPSGTDNMEAVVHSCVFNDKCFVIATYNDGKNYEFYDAVQVYNFTDGIINTTQAGHDDLIAAEIVAEVNRTTGYTAAVDGSVNTIVRVSGVSDNSYTLGASVSTVGNGNLSAKQDNQPISASTAAISLGSFITQDISIGLPTGNPSIISITVNGTEILYGAPDKVTVVELDTLATFNQKVAEAINRNSATSGYSATANNQTVQIKALTAGSAPNGFDIVVTSDIGTGTDGVAVIVDLCQFTVGCTSAQSIRIDSLVVNGTNILSTTFTLLAAGSATDFMRKIAKDINTYAIGSGVHYVANYFRGGAPTTSINLSRKASSSADAASVTVVVNYTQLTGTPTFSFTGQGIGFAATASPSVDNITIFFNNTVVKVTPQGGTPGYTYLWQYVSGSTAIFPSNSKALATKFYSVGQGPQAVSAVWKCIVTDSASPTPSTADTNFVTINAAGINITPQSG